MRFVLAEAEGTSDRVKGVLDAAYADFVTGWAVAPRDDPAGRVGEALFVARGDGEGRSCPRAWPAFMAMKLWCNQSCSTRWI